MRFSTARLCGGKAIVAIPYDNLDLDMDKVIESLKSHGFIILSEDCMMIVLHWKNMETTIYKQGKIMFFPLEDRMLCIRYATELLGLF